MYIKTNEKQIGRKEVNICQKTIRNHLNIKKKKKQTKATPIFIIFFLKIKFVITSREGGHLYVKLNLKLRPL